MRSIQKCIDCKCDTVWKDRSKPCRCFPCQQLRDEKIKDRQDAGRQIWLLMFAALKGGAACNPEQMELYNKARDLAHASFDLGERIVMR